MALEFTAIGLIVKHMSGNMWSRLTDFLATGGEKPGRNRDSEFVEPPTRETLLAMWESRWACIFAALEPLSDADLSRTIYIRGEAHAAMQANRKVSGLRSQPGVRWGGKSSSPARVYTAKWYWTLVDGLKPPYCRKTGRAGRGLPASAYPFPFLGGATSTIGRAGLFFAGATSTMGFGFGFALRFVCGATSLMGFAEGFRLVAGAISLIAPALGLALLLRDIEGATSTTFELAFRRETSGAISTTGLATAVLRVGGATSTIFP